jgi:glycosyltransferase involved in cell wall biosynthesis
MVTHLAPKMKIFLLRPTMGQGGADRVTLILLQKLDRQLFDLSLILIKEQGEFLSDVPADVKVYLLNATNVLSAWLPLIKLLRREKPAILFSTSGGTNVSAVIAYILSGQRCRLILSERNILFHGGRSRKRRFLVFLKRLFYHRADQIISLSHGVKNDLVQELQLPPEMISVVHSPIDIASIRQQETEAVEHPWFREDMPIVLGVGRFVVEKDFPTLINAFANLRSQRAARLVILGEGGLRASLIALVKQLKLENDVWFAGFDKNPFKYMAKCTLFVVSSRHEGLCTVLIQAMACGAPVITTNYEVGALEIVEPDKDGLVIPVGDVKALTEKMGYLLDHPIVRQQLGEQARLSAQRFGADLLVDKHVAAMLGE